MKFGATHRANGYAFAIAEDPDKKSDAISSPAFRYYEASIKFYADWNGFIAGYDDWLMRIADVSDFAPRHDRNRVPAFHRQERPARYYRIRIGSFRPRGDGDGSRTVGVGSDMDVLGNPNPVGGPDNISTQPNFPRYNLHRDADGKITISGFDHAQRMYDLTEGLIRRKYSDANIRLMLDGNWVRTLGTIWPKA